MGDRSGSPGRPPRFGLNVVDPTSLACANGRSSGIPAPVALSPRHLHLVQKVEIPSGLSDRPQGSLGIILGIADPRQAKVIARHENPTDGLQQLQLILELKKLAVAAIERPQPPAESVTRVSFRTSCGHIPVFRERPSS